MRPLAVLLGIVMGSAVSVTIGLAMTLIVFASLPEASDRVASEFAPLTRLFVGVGAFAAVASASFYGELRDRPWRYWTHAALSGATLLGCWQIYRQI